jgi:CheY-like chemotaxis protein
MTKILVVEDSKFLRLATGRALARAGYEVITAADGEEAVKKARENLPQLILLDLLLPKVTGTDVLKALKKDPLTAGIAVVVLTGMSQKNEDWLRRDGAFAFLGKSELALEKGAGALLAAVADVLKKLHLEVPARARGHELGA